MSIITKISITFIFSFILISIASYWLYDRIDYRETYLSQMRYDNAKNILISAFTQDKPVPKDELKLMDFELIEKPKNPSLSDLNHIKEVPLSEMFFGFFEDSSGKKSVEVEVYNSYVYLKDLRVNDKTKQIILIGYIAVSILLILLFWNIVRSLYPLKDLQKKVLKFGDGDFAIDCTTYKNDEIGVLARAFDDSVKSVKTLMDARMLFLRNAAHELKTPLTKGMIALELPDTPKKKEMLNKVFTKLGDLVKELMDIEKITSGKIEIYKEDLQCKDVVKDLRKMMFLDKCVLKHNAKNHILYGVDKRLFLLALKNLLDNGLKHSQNERVKLIFLKDKIAIINIGNELNRPLNEYLEPFAKDCERQDGFGLGLFIVNHILKAHNFHLEYNYKNGKSKFVICMD